MDYLLIIALQFIGIGLHVAQKINVIDKKYPEFTMKECIITFFNEDWITLFVSALVLFLDLIAHYIVHEFSIDSTNWVWSAYPIINYYTLSFALALGLGYFGQRKIYQWLGSAEKILDQKVQQIGG